MKIKRWILIAALIGLQNGLSYASTFVVSDTINYIQKATASECNLTSWTIAVDQPNLRTSMQQYKCGGGVWLEFVLADNPVITAISRVTVNDPQAKLGKAAFQALDQKLIQSFKDKMLWSCDPFNDATRGPSYKCHGSDKLTGSYEIRMSMDLSNPLTHDIRFQTVKSGPK